MMAKPEIKTDVNPKQTSSGEYPNKPPSKNYIPFENPLPKCKKESCPNLTNNECGYCNFHCTKLHQGIHRTLSNEQLKKLVKKYLDDKDKK